MGEMADAVNDDSPWDGLIRECPTCEGSKLVFDSPILTKARPSDHLVDCPDCEGTGIG